MPTSAFDAGALVGADDAAQGATGGGPTNGVGGTGSASSLGGSSSGGASSGGLSSGGASSGGLSSGGASSGGSPSGGTGGTGMSDAAAGSAGASAGGAGAGGSGSCPADTLANDVERCPGSLLVLTGMPPSVSVTGTTNGRSDDHDLCNGGGKDSVYRFVAPLSGTVRVSLAPDGIRGTLYVTEGTCGSGATLVCENPGTIDTPSSGTFTATACATYYVFADQELGIFDGTFVLDIAYE